MTIESAPYYWLRCDFCGKTQGDFNEDYSAWGKVEYALEIATDSEWTIVGEKHACPECSPIAECRYCGTVIGGPMDRNFGERDELCVKCFVADNL